MAAQIRIAGLDRLEIEGEIFQWSAEQAAYLSRDIAPRTLDEEETKSWRLKFNTGRMYTAQGQEIEAKIISHEDCPLVATPLWRLHFIDHSRGICGAVDLYDVTAEALMAAYDAGRYEGLWTGAF